MREKLSQLKLRKGAMVARASQARGGGTGSEQLGSKGGSSAFDNFRRMEEKIEGARGVEGAAMAEVEEALGKGEKTDDIEAKFRDLERQVGKGGGSAGSSDIEDELAALKKRIRV